MSGFIMVDGIRVFGAIMDRPHGTIKPGSVFTPCVSGHRPCGYIAGTNKDGSYLLCYNPPAWLIDPDASWFPHTTDPADPRGYMGYVSVLCTYHFNHYLNQISGYLRAPTITPALNAAIAWNKLLKAHCAS